MRIARSFGRGLIIRRIVARMEARSAAMRGRYSRIALRSIRATRHRDAPSRSKRARTEPSLESFDFLASFCQGDGSDRNATRKISASDLQCKIRRICNRTPCNRERKCEGREAMETAVEITMSLSAIVVTTPRPLHHSMGHDRRTTNTCNTPMTRPYSDSRRTNPIVSTSLSALCFFC